LPSADDPQIFIASAGKSEHRILAVAIAQTLSETGPPSKRNPRDKQTRRE